MAGARPLPLASRPCSRPARRLRRRDVSGSAIWRGSRRPARSSSPRRAAPEGELKTNVDAVARASRRYRRPRRVHRLRARKLGRRGRRPDRLREGSGALAGRRGRASPSSASTTATSPIRRSLWRRPTPRRRGHSSTKQIAERGPPTTAPTKGRVRDRRRRKRSASSATSSSSASERTFKAAVDASDGDSLADEDPSPSAIAAASEAAASPTSTSTSAA